MGLSHALLTLAFLLLLLVGVGAVLEAVIRFVARHRLRPVLRVAIAVVLAPALVCLGLTYYVYHGFGHQLDMLRRVRTEEPVVAITFDDGPSPEFTPRILDVLSEYGVKATFFVVGAHAERYPDVLERIHREGHEIGNHTYTHPNVLSCSGVTLSSEMLRTTLVILEVTGEYPRYTRPPRGIYDARFRRIASLLGQRVVLWSLSSQDWMAHMGSSAITRRVLGRVRPGDIILFHDSGALLRSEGASRRSTVEALPQVIEGLHAAGFRIVPLSELVEFPVVPESEIMVDEYGELEESVSDW